MVARESKGLFYGGGFVAGTTQALRCLRYLLICSGIITLILALILKFTIGLRLDANRSRHRQARARGSGYGAVPAARLGHRGG